MNLGKFSVSLAVKDIAASKAFYETLGFAVIGGQEDQGWLILDNQGTTIGLFQGMFERNLMTFNPGWDASGKELAEFTDVRELQAALKAHGVAIEKEIDGEGSGPASLMIVDPDGNPILLDQHV